MDLCRDTPEQIARVLVENVTPSGAEKIAAAIRAELSGRDRALYQAGDAAPNQRYVLVLCATGIAWR